MVAAVVDYDRTLPVLCLPGSVLAPARRRTPACAVVAEGFADRAYLPDGTLVPRGQPGAVVTDPDEVVARAVRMAADAAWSARRRHRACRCPVESLCLHGDTPGAVAAAPRWSAAAPASTPASRLRPVRLTAGAPAGPLRRGVRRPGRAGSAGAGSRRRRRPGPARPSPAGSGGRRRARRRRRRSPPGRPPGARPPATSALITSRRDRSVLGAGALEQQLRRGGRDLQPGRRAERLVQLLPRRRA